MTADLALEEDLEQSIYEACAATGWAVAHFRPCRTKYGWRTAVSGDGAGFPDFVLVHPRGGVLFVELKSATGRLTLDQMVWRDRFIAAGADWRLVTGAIEAARFKQDLADRATRPWPPVKT